MISCANSGPAAGSSRLSTVTRLNIRVGRPESAAQASSHRTKWRPIERAGVSHMRAMLRTPEEMRFSSKFWRYKTPNNQSVGTEEDAHAVGDRRHYRTHRQHLQARPHSALPREERPGRADQEEEGAGEDGRDRQRTETRKRRASEKPPDEISDDGDRSSDQSRDPVDEPLAARLLALRRIQAQLLAGLRLEPPLLVLRDAMNDRLRLISREALGTSDVDQLGLLELLHRLH